MKVNRKPIYLPIRFERMLWCRNGRYRDHAGPTSCSPRPRRSEDASGRRREDRRKSRG
jgi:hypothetical protein